MFRVVTQNIASQNRDIKVVPLKRLFLASGVHVAKYPVGTQYVARIPPLLIYLTDPKTKGVLYISQKDTIFEWIKICIVFHG